MRVQSQNYLDAVNSARRQQEASQAQENGRANRARSEEVEQAQARHAENIRRAQESQAASQRQEMKLAQEGSV